MPELLIELLSEEVPARMQARGSEDFRALVVKRLTEAGIAPVDSVVMMTPRRLALSLRGLPTAQPDRNEEKKGPRVGAPDQAVQGFLKAAGLASLDQAEKRDTGKGEFWFAVASVKGRPTEEILPALLVGCIMELGWPKSMRWRDTRFNWVRPLRNLLGLFDGKVLEGGLHLGHNVEGGAMDGFAAAGEGPNWLPFTNRTQGHRFMAPDWFEVAGWEDYREKLAKAKVELDPAHRRKVIWDGALSLAAADGLTLVEDEGLLAEVAGLVEWPVPLIGRIDQGFMDLPPEVLTTSMRTHQKYFSLRQADGSAAARFITVANVEAADRGAAIVAGNERVLRARLSDAKFFWDQDRKVRLEDFAARLDARIFHAKLGTVADKIDRLETLARHLASLVGADAGQAARAARLAKADLSSGMVGEFPELQGIMGRYYAIQQGEPAAVADAIAAHYRPQGPGDACPTGAVALAVALADKLDSLAGFYAIGEKPTGSKDPFALRRAALGVLRIIREGKLSLGLRDLFARALAGFGDRRDAAADERVIGELLEFMGDRLEVDLRGAGLGAGVARSVFALGDDDFRRLESRAQAVQAFLNQPWGQQLLTAYRRATNILRIEEKKDGRAYAEAPDTGLFAPEEAALASELDGVRKRAEKDLQAAEFYPALEQFETLCAPVDAFFEKVTVNAPDPALRANRLRLLNGIRATFHDVADFSLIEG